MTWWNVKGSSLLYWENRESSVHNTKHLYAFTYGESRYSNNLTFVIHAACAFNSGCISFVFERLGCYMDDVFFDYYLLFTSTQFLSFSLSPFNFSLTVNKNIFRAIPTRLATSFLMTNTNLSVLNSLLSSSKML